MFVDLPVENLNIPTLIIDQSKIDIDKNIFIDNDIIIIKSGTATSKTKCIAKNMKYILEKYNECKLLSIVNLISLSKEQMTTFETEGNIKLNNYQTSTAKKFLENNSVICVNSLEKIINLPDTYFKNVILFIDEVNDLLNSLTHNNTLDSNLNIIYKCLMKLIKNSKKIIFSDATINQNVLNFISSRTENNKTILINNTNKKFSGINAIKYNDEDEFYKKLDDCIKNNQYFLFGCDIRSKLEKYYEDFISKYKDKVKNEEFILITSKTNFYLNNASSQFKNKFVFYSPSITTGVSFVLEDTSQIQFIYISNNPQINPVSIYQMSSRTRNMKELIYYCENIKHQKMKYETLKELESAHKKFVEINDKILRLSRVPSINEEDEIIENSYFKMFCYNEFLEQIYRTDFLKHYQNILSNNGFNLIEKGETKKLNIKQNIKQTNLIDKMKHEEIEKFIEICFNDDPETNVNIEDINYVLLLKRNEILGLNNKEDVEKYKLFIQDEYALNNLFNFQKLFRTNEFIDEKLKEKNTLSKRVKNLSTTYTKINLLRYFEKMYNINRLDMEFKDITPEKQLTKEDKSLFSNVFRTKKGNLKTKENIIKYYVGLLKNICGDLPLIKSSQIGRAKDRKRVYTLNEELMKHLIYLTKQKNPTLKHYNLELIEKLTGMKPDKAFSKKAKTIEDFDDVEKAYNTYLYNKFGKNY
jgi:hypothetical protein